MVYCGGCAWPAPACFKSFDHEQPHETKLEPPETSSSELANFKTHASKNCYQLEQPQLLSAVNARK